VSFVITGEQDLSKPTIIGVPCFDVKANEDVELKINYGTDDSAASVLRCITVGGHELWSGYTSDSTVTISAERIQSICWEKGLNDLCL
jgi:hypothetical protein